MNVPDLGQFRRRRQEVEDISHLGPAVLLKQTSIKPATYRDGGRLEKGLVIGFERLDGEVSVMFHTLADLENLRRVLDDFLEHHADDL